MPEGLTVEVAHKLSEKEEEAEHRKHRWQEIAEVVEVLVLAVAAVATAWSGFQASQRDDRHALTVWAGTTQHFEASAASTLGGQLLVADSAAYKNPGLEKASQLNAEAAAMFTEGTEAGETAAKYVRLTVLFALVLFLIAAGQRFRQRPVRISANALAICLLIYALVMRAELVEAQSCCPDCRPMRSEQRRGTKHRELT